MDNEMYDDIFEDDLIDEMMGEEPDFESILESVINNEFIFGDLSEGTISKKMQSAARKNIMRSQNNAATITINNAAVYSNLKKRLKKAKNASDIASLISIIDKNLTGMNKYKKTRISKGNIIPGVDKAVKTKSIESFCVKLEKLKESALAKKKTLNTKLNESCDYTGDDIDYCAIINEEAIDLCSVDGADILCEGAMTSAMIKKWKNTKVVHPDAVLITGLYSYNKAKFDINKCKTLEKLQKVEERVEKASKKYMGKDLLYYGIVGETIGKFMVDKYNASMNTLLRTEIPKKRKELMKNKGALSESVFEAWLNEE